MSFNKQIQDIIMSYITDNTNDVQDSVNQITDIMNNNNIHSQPLLGQEDCYLVDELLDSRVNSNGKKEYLVKWDNDQFEPSWEPEENINSEVIRSFLLTREIQQHNIKIQGKFQNTTQTPRSAHVYLRVSDPTKTASLFKSSTNSQSQNQSTTTLSGGNGGNGGSGSGSVTQHQATSYQAYFANFPAGNFSLESQKEILLQYCLENKFVVSSIEMDDGVSARNPDKLKGLQKIVKSIKSGETLLILDLSRFARNTLGGLQILEDLCKRNVHIYSVLDGMNYDTPASRHCVRTTISCAQLESDIKSMKLKASIQNIKNKGGYIGSRAPFGYKVVREGTLRKLVEEPAERKILDMMNKIQKISIKSDTAKKYNIIADKLNNSGVRNRGKKFTKESVKYILSTSLSKHTKHISATASTASTVSTRLSTTIQTRFEEQRKQRNHKFMKNRLTDRLKSDVNVNQNRMNLVAH
jgi:DNA invertase Pin-like site-specific DNA recombinase